MFTYIIVSAYANPLGPHHIEYFKKAAELGNYTCLILNNDEQVALKKGISFLPASERKKIVEELRCINYVFNSIDEDRSVAQSLHILVHNIYQTHQFCLMIQKYKDKTIDINEKPLIKFVNDGDVSAANEKEIEVCNRLGVELVYLGNPKVNSSSWILNNVGREWVKRNPAEASIIAAEINN